MQTLRVGIIDQLTYSEGTGIGNVLAALLKYTSGVDFVPVDVVRLPFPGLRLLPARVKGHQEVGAVLAPDLRSALAAARCGPAVRKVAIVHDLGIYDCARDWEQADFVERTLIRRAAMALLRMDQIVCVSEFTAYRLMVHVPVPPSRVRVIPLGVNRELFQWQGRRQEARRLIEARRGWRLPSHVMLYVGSEAPRKGVRELIELAGRIKRRRGSVCLIKVGRPGRPEWRRRTVEAVNMNGLELGRDVVFCEDVSNPELGAFYAMADVFVSCSIYEGFCLPVAEASACGTTCVVLRNGALPEVATQLGFVVSSVEDMMVAVDQVFTTGDVQKCQWHRSWHDVGREFQSCLEELVESKVRR
jgi:glycosyltransferase involved in cell wall biosynthesis